MLWVIHKFHSHQSKNNVIPDSIREQVWILFGYDGSALDLVCSYL